MKIKLEEANRIYNKYGDDDVPLVFLSDVFLNTGINRLQLSRGMKYNPSHYEIFQSANVNEIDVIYSEKLFGKLVANFPGIYRQPEGRKNIVELDRIIDGLETANAVTKRKRTIISLCEVYKKNQAGNFEPVLYYGEKLSYQRWNQVKVNLSRSAIIDYRYDEVGILIFFILNSSDPQYPQKFMNFTELVSLIVECKKMGVSIYSDFNGETDVFTCNNKSDLIKMYNDSRASLVVIGDDINDEYKASLNQLKSFDRYAKMMVINKPDPTQKTAILNQIKSVYGKKLWIEE